MEPEQMLEAVIEKAIEGGFDFWGCSKKPPDKLGAPYNENLVVVEEAPPTFRWFVMVYGSERLGDNRMDGTIGCVWEGDYYSYPPTEPCEQCGLKKEYPKIERASGGLENWDIFKTLLNHDFAKAYFADIAVCSFCGHPVEGGGPYCGHDMESTRAMWNWQYHLTKAVLSEDPLLYYYITNTYKL